MASGEERRDLGIGESRDAAAYTGDEEREFGVILGKKDELIDIRTDSIDAAVHGGNAVTLSLQAHSLSPDGSKLTPSCESSSTAMCTLQVAAKHKDLAWPQLGNHLGSISFLFHFFVCKITYFF